MFQNLLWRLTQHVFREESIVIREDHCLLQFNRFLECQKCVEVCPANALTIKEDQPILQKEKCLLCGRCISICPSSVFDYTISSNISLLQDVMKKSQHQTLSIICTKMSGSLQQNKESVMTVPCLLRLSHLFFLLGIALDRIIEIPIGRCLSFECPQKKVVPIILEEELKKTDSIISGSSSNIVQREDFHTTERGDRASLSRRHFLQLFTSGAHDLKENTLRITEDMIKELIHEGEENALLQYNSLLFFLLTEIKKSQSHLFERVEYLPLKTIKMEDSCVYCQMCMKACPTKALKAENGTIYYRPFYCLNCGICSTICDYGAISFGDPMKPNIFLKKSREPLIELELTHCKVCSGVFSPTKKERDYCFICRANRHQKVRYSEV